MPNTSPAPRMRLDYLDSVRACAALVVVVGHHCQQGMAQRALSLPELWLANHWLKVNHFAVAVFIVLSGYLLMLPVARSAEGQLQGGVMGYIKRRARRILPPYYAALVLSLLVILAVPEMRHVSGTPWDWALPAFNAGSICSHALLVHNLSGKWIGTINTPLWSVAMEWQIYFVFGLLMLPLWRRFGILSVLSAAFLVTALPYLLGVFHKFEATCPWYVLLFAMGMTGALINFSADEWAQNARKVVPWQAVSIVLSVCAFGLITFTKATAGLDLPVRREIFTTSWWEPRRPAFWCTAPTGFRRRPSSALRSCWAIPAWSGWARSPIAST